MCEQERSRTEQVQQLVYALKNDGTKDARMTLAEATRIGTECGDTTTTSEAKRQQNRRREEEKNCGDRRQKTNELRKANYGRQTTEDELRTHTRTDKRRGAARDWTRITREDTTDERGVQPDGCRRRPQLIDHNEWKKENNEQRRTCNGGEGGGRQRIC